MKRSILLTLSAFAALCCPACKPSDPAPEIIEAASLLDRRIARGECRAEVEAAAQQRLIARVICKTAEPLDEPIPVSQAQGWIILVGNRHALDLESLFESIPQLSEFILQIKLESTTDVRLRTPWLVIRLGRDVLPRIAEVRQLLVRYLLGKRQTTTDRLTDLARTFIELVDQKLGTTAKVSIKWNDGLGTGSQDSPIEPNLDLSPLQPMEPLRPLAPTKPTQPDLAAQPVQPAQPTQPAQPMQPAQPIQPTQPDFAQAGWAQAPSDFEKVQQNQPDPNRDPQPYEVKDPPSDWLSAPSAPTAQWPSPAPSAPVAPKWPIDEQAENAVLDAQWAPPTEPAPEIPEAKPAEPVVPEPVVPEPVVPEPVVPEPVVPEPTAPTAPTIFEVLEQTESVEDTDIEDSSFNSGTSGEQPTLPPEPTLQAEPVELAVREITASTFQPEMRGKSGIRYTFSPSNLLDQKLETSWQPRSGAQAYVNIELASRSHIVAIEIANGFQWKNDEYGDLFDLNGRVTKLRIDADGKTVKTLNLADTRGWQTHEIEFDARNIRLTLVGTRPGSKWKDIALSEVRFLGQVLE